MKSFSWNTMALCGWDDCASQRMIKLLFDCLSEVKFDRPIICRIYPWTYHEFDTAITKVSHFAIVGYWILEHSFIGRNSLL